MSTKTAKRASARQTASNAATKKATKPARKATARRAAPRAEKTARPRDPRLPAPGSTLIRPYKGKDYEIEVLESGFRWNGEEYPSLSKLASVITGQVSINGYLWARLTEPKARPAKFAKKASRQRAAKKTDDVAPSAEAADAK